MPTTPISGSVTPVRQSGTGTPVVQSPLDLNQHMTFIKQVTKSPGEGFMYHGRSMYKSHQVQVDFTIKVLCFFCKVCKSMEGEEKGRRKGREEKEGERKEKGNEGEGNGRRKEGKGKEKEKEEGMEKGKEKEKGKGRRKGRRKEGKGRRREGERKGRRKGKFPPLLIPTKPQLTFNLVLMLFIFLKVAEPVERNEPDQRNEPEIIYEAPLNDQPHTTFNYFQPFTQPSENTNQNIFQVKTCNSIKTNIYQKNQNNLANILTVLFII